jgi:hypothetical protein
VVLGFVSVTLLTENAEGVMWARPLERVVPRWALAEGVIQMVDLELKELLRSEAALLPEIVPREAYSAASCYSKE